jgi:hypothetical protein
VADDPDDELSEALGWAAGGASETKRKVDERLRAASDPTTTPGVLAALADAPEPAVRRAVAANPNIAPETLAKIAEEFPDEFFENPALALCLLENPSLFADLPEATLAKLVAHPSMPSGLLVEATRHRAFYVRRAAAQNPRLPPALLVELAEKQSYFEEVAGNPSTPPDYLAKLARHDWVAVRRAASENPSIPEAAVAVLANDGDGKVRKAVVRNPAVTPELLTTLAKHESALVRLAIADCPRTPAKTLLALESDSDGAVRFTAARTRAQGSHGRGR